MISAIVSLIDVARLEGEPKGGDAVAEADKDERPMRRKP